MLFIYVSIDIVFIRSIALNDSFKIPAASHVYMPAQRLVVIVSAGVLAPCGAKSPADTVLPS